jgi:hypothetical protein
MSKNHSNIQTEGEALMRQMDDLVRGPVILGNYLS